MEYGSKSIPFELIIKIPPPLQTGVTMVSGKFWFLIGNRVNIKHMENAIGTQIPVARHLDDVDDLRTFGRDGELLPNQEEGARNYAMELVKRVHQEGKGAILLLCSTRLRGVQTGELIVEQIKEIDPSIKSVLSTNEALANMYEGAVHLPDDYKTGDKFPGFSIARDAFSKEVFGEHHNFLYRFGDPVKFNGGHKYPELVGYFDEYGESYRDFLVRMFDFILNTAKNLDRLNNKTKIALITHSQQYQMFYHLQSVMKDVQMGKLDLNPGELPLICWQRYLERIGLEKPVYDVRYIDTDGLYDDKNIEILEQEISYLKDLK
jgi:broad specificity phosphatase PhoE